MRQALALPNEQPLQAAARLICFICVNYHSTNLIAELLNSIEAEQDPNICCVIVDNSPYDTDLNELASSHQFILLKPNRNLGFGGGCNLALDYIEANQPGALAWLINPDARLIPGAISQVRRCLQHNPNLGLLGTRIEDSKGVAWFNSGYFDPIWGKLHQTKSDGSESSIGQHATNQRPTDHDWQSTRCDWLSGCSLIMDLQHLPTKTRFDTTIFLYYEDAELCLRLRKQGIQPYVTQQTLASHLISATMTRLPIGRYKHATFGKLYLLHKYATPLAIIANLAWFTASGIATLLQDSHQSIGKIAGIFAYLAWLIQVKPINTKRTNSASTISAEESSR